ncbi:cytochrome c oxidase assembly protein COX11, mitochondrial isoform X3 [Dioscorea cayenensis subsp. rotundata]|uniref:Cytochrome c oxidase assembly protein COX11, mitochondrial isoform X3 n=1 Tax=Dioscorea cayennensis subsp. rotundata TaxID=55577 RepID=A0AB40D6A1_DIOCR|nr:cytochrome c oxidase assembly protein COX11, mitochondrial isoform X3 [Dioscorea cayenensis subsp. rotundata]
MPPFPKCPSAAVLRRVVSSATASSSSRFQIPLHRLHPELPAFPTSGSRRFYISSTAARERSSRRTLLYLVGLAGAMVGASYAAVPLYRRFCQATGYGGTVQRRESVEEKISRHDQDGTTTSRELVVQFNADVADGVPWKFIPAQREVRVKPGESALAFYTAENRSSTPITGMSTYNVTPMKVFFYIDPEFETDPKMDGINNFILSYTFFKVKED